MPARHRTARRPSRPSTDQINAPAWCPRSMTGIKNPATPWQGKVWVRPRAANNPYIAGPDLVSWVTNLAMHTELKTRHLSLTLPR
jgi:hypothetical protein